MKSLNEQECIDIYGGAMSITIPFIGPIAGILVALEYINQTERK